MDEPVTSIFYANYYLRAIAGALLLLWLTGYRLYHCLMGDFLNPVPAYIFTLFLLGILWIYYYFFSKSWNRITVTATEIMVYNIVFKKQTTIPFADITHIATYRTLGGRRRLGSQRFIIEFKGDRSIEINESWYANYNKLTMAIYHDKQGTGHGRERYLERHPR
jgi:hypothetical protein